jgi:hypothetical protein
MILTWIRLWPLFFLPLFLLAPLGLLPEFSVGRIHISGGAVREWFLNTFLLPVLPTENGWHLVSWFSRADLLQEIFLHALITLDIALLLMPLIFGFGEFLIFISSFISRTEHAQKTRAARN